MALWIWPLTILSCFCITFSRNEELKFFQSATELNHLTVDNDTGILYLGVVNALYQLTENLEVIRSVETGPRKDNKKCTPPIDENQCKEAVLTDNYNKLLLLNKADNTTVVCGSLFKGICAIRDLQNISDEKYYVDSSGEKSFVASNDENVSTVGLITSLNNDQVLFVGKGNGPNDNGIIISTRQLYARDGKDIFEMYTDSAAVKSAYHSSSTQQFVAVFEDNNYVYFIFNQQEKQPVNNRTLIARLCKDDAHYYSYFEMDLGCKDDDGAYDHCHSAFVTTPGKELAENDKVLLALFSKVNKDDNSLKSAMCVFSLRQINEKMEKNRNDCYTKKNTSSFYKLFSAENPCALHGLNASKNFPCGSEHLPYLLGSRNGVIEKPVLQKEGMNLTAVTVAVENGHTVAFLGTSDGKILKVFLSSTATEYSSLTIERNKPVKKDLVLDQTQENLYVMTTDKVTCPACIKDPASYFLSRDPYCGWCVREGRCTKKADCGAADMENHWLWSPSGTCVTIISADPLNMSRRAPAKRKNKIFSQHHSGLSTDCTYYSRNSTELYTEGWFSFLKDTEYPGNREKCLNMFTVHLSVTLYNCSYGRSDCSLCLAARPEYKCVWCEEDGKPSKCVYEKLCHTAPTDTCPPPEITRIEPKTGPRSGGILLTIMGSNLGIKAEDVKSITVADKECLFKEEFYSVSTSLTILSLQEPHPSQITPESGPQAGGTRLTISGRNLATGSKKDVQVSVGSQPCNVTEFGDEIICITGRNNKVEPVPVIMNYGGTRIIVPQQFTYSENPTVTKFLPVNSFSSNLNKAMTIDEAQAFVGDEPCNIKTLTETDLYCEPPEVQPQPKKRQKRDTINNLPEFIVKFGLREWILGRVEYDNRVTDIPLNLILPLVLIPMLVIIGISIICYRRKSQQAEREYEKIKSQLEGLEESVRDRCKKEFTDLMIEMEDHTNDINEAGIPVLDYKTYTDRVFFLPSKDGEKDVMITGKLDIPEARRQTVEQALYQFSNLLNSKSFLINFIHTLENQREFSARAKVYFASLLTVALHGKLEYYTDIMRTLFLELMEQYVVAKNPKLMLRRSETVVERMLSNWMSICLYQYLKDNAGEPLYKLFKAIKHQVEKGPVDAVLKKAKYTLNDTGLLGDDVEYTQTSISYLGIFPGAIRGGNDSIPVKVLNCDTISQVKEKIIDQVYRNLPCSQWPKADSVVLEWRPGSTAQTLSDLDLTSQRDGRWKRINTLMHYNVRCFKMLFTPVICFLVIRHALLEDENKVWHLVRPVDEMDEGKSKRGSVKEKERTKAITEIYLTRLLSVKGTLQQFVDDFFHSVLNSNQVVPPAVKYFFDFLDEQAEKHDIKDEDTIHIWKTNSLPLRFWVNILKNPHFIFDVHVHEVVDASLSVIAQTFMDACTRTEHKLSRDSPSNKLLYAKEISNYKKMVEDYYKGIRQMVPVSDQDMNTHLAEISRAHTDSLNTLVALHQLYQYTNKYYDEIINALEEDPAAQKMQLAFRLQQIAAALENKVTDL
uniref:Plexin B2 n=1 Tax=Catharus ustulatus TaxID=91951 RepID=A0A8C3TZD5_CATUS